MSLRLRILVCSSLLALAVTAPASAQAQLPEDVTRIESAVVELGKAKRGAASELAATRRAVERRLASCRSKGPGWKRIRQVSDRSQREAYARGAKSLWNSLHEVALEGAALDVYTPILERFLRRFDRPLSDPVLEAAIEAHRKRLSYNRAAYGFGSCATFNDVLRRVREFKVGGSHGVAGDYYAGRIYNIFVRYAADRQRAAARKHWGARYDNALETARDHLKALGGNGGYADYFAFAHSLRF